MNIEGAEHLAIQGMLETVQLTQVLCVCCHVMTSWPWRRKMTAKEPKSAVQQFLWKNRIEIVERLEPHLPRYVAHQVGGYNQKLMRKAAS